MLALEAFISLRGQTEHSTHGAIWRMREASGLELARAVQLNISWHAPARVPCAVVLSDGAFRLPMLPSRRLRYGGSDSLGSGRG